MAKAGKSKLDLKQFLLAKGEYLAVGLAGLMLAVFLLWGASRWTSAKDPEKISKDLVAKAQNLEARIRNGEISPEDEAAVAPPPWITKKQDHRPVSVSDFPISGPQFDPIAKPDTKKENPVVLPIGAYQVDLVRAPMKGYDIIYDNEGRAKIAVLASSKVGAQDKEKLKQISEKIGKRGQTGAEKFRQSQRGPGGRPPGPGQPPGLGPGQPPGLGPGQPPGLGPGQPPGLGPGQPPGFGPGFPRGGEEGDVGYAGAGGYNPYGGPGGGFDVTGQREAKVLEYIPLEELDRALEAGKVPATTVVPLRMVVIHAEVPYKQQVEEIKRALRLPSFAEAQRYGPIYDGFEVQRRVTRFLPGMKEPEVLENWGTEYKFEDKYIELINSRKLADQIEDGYLAHFIRYDMALALPLPQLVTELGTYPNIRLESINRAIKAMRDANKPRADPSRLMRQLQGDRANLYRPLTGADTGASQLYGMDGGFGMEGPRPPVGPGGMGPGLPGPGGLRPPLPGGRPGEEGDGYSTVPPPVDLEHLLLRFVDVDVEPGRTYEYRIRLRMLNPNYNAKDVANPAYAKVERLYSPWTQIAGSVTIPAESFLYAADPAAYRKRIEEEFPGRDQKDVRERLQVKDNQVVVQLINWLEQVRVDASRKREPVGAWVVGEVPVGRGEYIGRKQYVKLPLWSSEANQYVLREVAESLPTAKKGEKLNLPKGWLVDFSTRSILVDFDGGRVKTRVGNREIVEDVDPELLVLRPDGKLVVKSAARDAEDENRKKLVETWEAWVKTVESRRVTTGTSGDDNPFLKKP